MVVQATGRESKQLKEREAEFAIEITSAHCAAEEMLRRSRQSALLADRSTMEMSSSEAEMDRPSPRARRIYRRSLRG